MFETVILGAGPAGTGPLVWAAGAGVLGAWLDRGIALVDQRPRMGGTLGRYALNADTLGATFLECLSDGAGGSCLAVLGNDPAAHALEAYRQGLPPLPLVGRFLDRLGAVLGAEIARHQRSRFIAETRVRALRLCRDGNVVAELHAADGRRISVEAASAVAALGGYQAADWEATELLPGLTLGEWRRKIIPSDRLLEFGGGMLTATRLAGRPRPSVVVLGGSHSALSAAWVLLERSPGLHIPRGGVQILYRTPPRVFYPSRSDANADGYEFTESDVCPATGRVHRLGGLRGDGRELWRRMRGLGGAPREDRATARPIGTMRPEELRRLLDAADLIVPAFGYRLRTVPVFDSDGRRVALAQSGPVVDAESRLRTEGGLALPNVFGVGLGSGFRPWGEMGGEASFSGQQNSLWLYQHGLGALIHQGVRLWSTQRRDHIAHAGQEAAPFRLARRVSPAPAPVPESASDPIVP
jgi:hypothetical protein